MSKDEKDTDGSGGDDKEEANIQTFVRIRPSKSPSGYIAMDSEHPGTLRRIYIMPHCTMPCYAR